MDSTEPVSYKLAIYANGCKCLKQGRLNVVARDGIEPPTPAFSGLRSKIQMPQRRAPPFVGWCSTSIENGTPCRICRQRISPASTGSRVLEKISDLALELELGAHFFLCGRILRSEFHGVQRSRPWI
jgi:hypothetical protein